MLNKTFLKNQTKIWVEKGIIDKNQAMSILGLYNLSYDDKNKNFSIISILGYLFLGLSVIVMIGHNWENLPALARAGLLIFTTLALHIISFYLFKTKNNSNLFFLANLLYGASIILIAQAYHLGTYAPDGVFWWAFGSFLVAIFIKNPWVNLQCFTLALIWLYMELDNDFYPFAFWIFLAFCAYSLYFSKQSKTLYFLFLSSIIYFVPYSLVYFSFGGAWVSYKYMEYYLFLTPFFGYLAFLSIYKLNLEPYFNMTKIYINLLVNFFSFFLLSKSIHLDFSLALWQKLPFQITLGIIIMPILALTIALKNKDLYIISAFFVCVITSFFLPYPFWLINIILFSYYAYNVYKGIMSNDFSRYFIASLSVLIFAFMRYISLIHDYITAAIFFFICALILLMSAKIFKKYSGALS